MTDQEPSVIKLDDRALCPGKDYRFDKAHKRLIIRTDKYEKGNYDIYKQVDQ